MDVAAILPVSAALPRDGLAALGGAAGEARRRETGVAGQRPDAGRRDAAVDVQATVAKREAATQAATEVAGGAAIRFTYEGQRQVMQVHDAKGALIYQVPSKGRLALLEFDAVDRQGVLLQTA